MKRILVLGVFCWVFTIQAGAQVISYNTALIPKTLQAYANAVVRLQESSTEVKDLDQVIYKYREAVTILNPQGAGYGQISVFYDKARQLKHLKVAVYDKEGNLIKKAGDKDFQEKAKARLEKMVTKAGIIVLASHNNSLLGRVCNRIISLDHGRIAWDGKADEYFARPGVK